MWNTTYSYGEPARKESARKDDSAQNGSSGTFVMDSSNAFLGESALTAAPSSLTVSQALAQAKSALETIRVTIQGEVSEFNDKPGYKAAYFSIADKSSALPCVMWRDKYNASGVLLKAGMMVEVKGYFTAYAAKGRMQFTVTSLKAAGEGDLRQKVAQLARKLQAEGLMDQRRKKPVPTFCQSVCLVTSPRGKAVHDVLRTLRRRNPLVKVKFCGVAVEGPQAPQKMIEGLKVADASGCDVILLVRGGGSYEDLMPFNDEALARFVASCETPVVTGIGHEPDNSICDMVADRRVSTPTAAAESIAPDVKELIAQCDASAHRLVHALERTVERAQMTFQRLVQRPVLSSSEVLLDRYKMLLAQSEDRLTHVIPEALERDQRQYQELVDRMRRIGENMTAPYMTRFNVGCARLESLSPLQVLKRGYSMAQNEQGDVIDSITKVEPHEKLNIRVKDGSIHCVVDQVSAKSTDITVPVSLDDTTGRV